MITHLVSVPGPPLSDYVEFLWYVSGKFAVPNRYMLLPDATVVLIINLGDPQMLCAREDIRQQKEFRKCWISGQQREPLVLQQTGNLRIAGIRFKPAGAARFLASPLSELGGKVIEFESTSGFNSVELREQLGALTDPSLILSSLEGWLRRLLNGDCPLNRRMAFAAGQLDSGAPIGQITSKLGVSNKHLIHEFKKHVGIGPKYYGRVKRLQRLIHQVGYKRQINWSDLAIDTGYYDHSHLVNDFRELTGITPNEFLIRRAPYIGYVNVA